MEKLKDYILLHLNIMLFSFTSVFSKLASQQFNKHGLFSAGMIGFSFLMLLNCFVYAIAWQKVIKKRLTASERELAKISAVKREENLQELREKNNTRVLQGLMEDFMEAV